MTAQLLEQFSVYAVMDGQGGTLYVGQTANPQRRLREHARRSVWWQFAHEVQIVSVKATRREALDLEVFLIRGCHPQFNLQHGDKHGARERLILAEFGLTEDEFVAGAA